jgi:hypothetical protein
MSEHSKPSDVAFVEEKERSCALEEKAGLPDISGDFSPAQQRSIRRRVDLRLCLPLGLMYAISLVDKTNLSSANIAGMKDDLGLGIGTRILGREWGARC